jgi:hypothetical protein
MEKQTKTYEILRIILIVLTIAIGVITIVDIFVPDPVFALDEAALASITGLLTFLITLVSKKEDELKNGINNKMDSKDIEELTNKATNAAKAVKSSRRK